MWIPLWCNLRASFWVLSLARHTPFVKRPTRNPFSQDDSPIPRMDRLFKYLCIWSIKFLCIKIKDLVGSGKNCSLFKSSSSTNNNNNKFYNKQQILLKIGKITNYITFPSANSLWTNRGGGSWRHITKQDLYIDGLNNSEDTTIQ